MNFELNYVALGIASGCIVVDIITGLLKCYFHKSEKNKDGGTFKSSIMRKCGLQKLGVIGLMIVINVLSAYFSVPYLTEVCYTYYIATETLSVMENLQACGVPLPHAIVSFMKSKQGDDDDEQRR